MGTNAGVEEELLDGRCVVVTGANSGLGRATAELLAAQGARVVMACRSGERAKVAIEEIRRVVPDADVVYLPLDLASASSIRRFADELQGPVHALVNNAGGVFPGLEAMFDANVWGHVRLADALLPRILEARGKVVNVSSSAHRMAVLPRADQSLPDFLATDRSFRLRQYGFAKLCLIWHARYLHDEHAASGLRTYSLHPGEIRTPGADNDTASLRMRMLQLWLKFVVMDPDVRNGVQTTLHCLANPEADTESGHYWRRCRIAEPAHAYDRQRAEELVAYCLAGTMPSQLAAPRLDTGASDVAPSAALRSRSRSGSVR